MDHVHRHTKAYFTLGGPTVTLPTGLCLKVAPCPSLLSVRGCGQKGFLNPTVGKSTAMYVCYYASFMHCSSLFYIIYHFQGSYWSLVGPLFVDVCWCSPECVV
jgi:hypothetical protein